MDDLQAGLERLGPRLGGAISGLERLSAGASKETWSFRAGGEDLILRRSPGGEAISSAIALPTEAALVQAAFAAGVPVPRVVHVCEPGEGVGEAYVMERIEGETLGRRIVRDEAFSHRKADSGRGAGDENGLACKSAHGMRSPLSGILLA